MEDNAMELQEAVKDLSKFSDKLNRVLKWARELKAETEILRKKYEAAESENTALKKEIVNLKQLYGQNK